MNQYAPDTYITNPVINWGEFYVEIVQSVIDGTWKPDAHLRGLKENMSDIAPFGKNVPQDVQDAVEAKRKELIDGKLEVFAGPIYDQKGELRVPEGESMTVEEILAMDWFVKGIKGTIPK